MVRVWAPSRLHFGLLSLAADGGVWPDRHGRATLAARRFGGVGLMVDRPGVQVRATPSNEWLAEGPLADRALEFARRWADGIHQERPDQELPPQRLTIEQAPPEHVGLGAGTQLGLAVARALAETYGLNVDGPELARRVGRGLRSALGVHGFAHGGFLVESGKRGDEALAPFVARAAFPSDWRVVVALPREAPGLHDADEREAFVRLAGRPGATAHTDALCRLVLLGMLPALAEADLDAFGEALFDFNARVGEAFAAVQGGVYSGPGVTACVDFLRGQGVRGVGQSSWGPAVFAVVGDEDWAADLTRRLAAHGPDLAQVWTASACNVGARIWHD